MLGDQTGQLRGRLLMATQVEFDRQPGRLRRQTQLVQPLPLAVRVLAPDTGQRRPPPQTERITQALRRALGVSRTSRPLGLGELLPEDAQIQLARRGEL